MKIKNIKLQPYKIKFKDNFNFQLIFNGDCLMEVDDHIYRFHDKPTMLRFMLSKGITCGCERSTKNGKLIYLYNKKPMNEGQIEFLRNRARALMQITDMNSGVVIKNECKCKKKKGPE